jgi:hypothetical protein
MGAKSWMLVYAADDARRALAASRELDRAATRKFAGLLFPGQALEDVGDAALSCTCPPAHEIHVGCFPGVSIVAAKEFGIDRPSRLPAHLVKAGRAGTLHLHAMCSVVDWFAYALWVEGKLQRSLSLSPDTGILEDIGPRMLFELPYWSGDHAVLDESNEQRGYPLPFHPLDLGDAAARELFGFRLDGLRDRASPDPRTVPLVHYRRSRSRWRVWS